jgi:hypothetical protein
MNKYWLKDNLGKIEIFEAENDIEARHYFYSSGDHAYDYGRADKKFFKEALEGKWDIYKT